MKKKVKKAIKAKKETPKPVAEMIAEKENQFNFAGLPERDLKKNLGCG